MALGELQKLARETLEKLPSDSARGTRAAVIALSGELGAGKTTFVQALAKELGVSDTVQSPTYVLMKSYDIAYKHFTKLVHIDAYRLNTAEEFNTLRPETFLADPANLVCIEWPERVEGVLPKPDVVLKFSSENMDTENRHIAFV